MKKLTQMKLIMVAIMIATILVGCKKPVEQSSVSIDDFKERACIMGTLQYDEGQGFDGTNYTRLIKPAANVTVTAYIAKSEFSSTSKGSGNLTYTTKTDANGSFKFELPVTNDGVKVKVEFANFMGKYHSIIDVQNGEPVYLDKEVVYSFAAKEFTTLMPNDVEVVDGIFTSVERENAEEYTYYSEYKVIVGKATYAKSTTSDGQLDVNKKYAIASDVDVIIEVEYEDNCKFKYVAKTDKEGIATFNIPTTTLNWSPKQIKITANTFSTEKFVYMERVWNEATWSYEVKESILIGKFEQIDSFTDKPKFTSIEDLPAPEIRVKMNFSEFKNSGSNYSSESWSGVDFEF